MWKVLLFTLAQKHTPWIWATFYIDHVIKNFHKTPNLITLLAIEIKTEFVYFQCRNGSYLREPSSTVTSWQCFGDWRILPMLSEIAYFENWTVFEN